MTYTLCGNIVDLFFVFQNVIVLITLCQNQGDNTLKNHVELNMRHGNNEEEYGNNQVTMCINKSMIRGVILQKNKYFHQILLCEQITFTWENITVVKENGGGSCFRKKKEPAKTILNNGEYVENNMTPYSNIY